MKKRILYFIEQIYSEASGLFLRENIFSMEHIMVYRK